MVSSLLAFFSSPTNLVLVAIMTITGIMLVRDRASAHRLGVSCEALPPLLNIKKNRGVMLHQASDLALQIKNADAAQENSIPYLRGIANTSHLIIQAGELTGEGFKQLLPRLEKVAKKNNPLILLDQDAKMAKHLAKTLAKNGWDVYFLEGGLNAWLVKKLPCVNIYKEASGLLNKNNKK